MVIVTERRIVRRFSALKPVFAERPLRQQTRAGDEAGHAATTVERLLVNGDL
jgi:hypothetical protein